MEERGMFRRAFTVLVTAMLVVAFPAMAHETGLPHQHWTSLLWPVLAVAIAGVWQGAILFFWKRSQFPDHHTDKQHSR